MTFIDMPAGEPAPKRGDLLQSNVGDRRERTWLILRARKGRTANRYTLVMARWWELLPATRMRLYISAERNGGQRVIWFKRYPAKKRKQTFEQWMCRMPDSEVTGPGFGAEPRESFEW